MAPPACRSRGTWRPPPPGQRPPPLALHLVVDEGREALLLVARASPAAPPRVLGERAIQRGVWIDLVFHVKCSTGNDGFVQAWANGRSFTKGTMAGPTLYSPASNYLRIGLYRGKGVPTTNQVYLDEVRLGASYQSVAP
jgi:hypothetical protein